MKGFITQGCTHSLSLHFEVSGRNFAIKVETKTNAITLSKALETGDIEIDARNRVGIPRLKELSFFIRQLCLTRLTLVYKTQQTI